MRLGQQNNFRISFSILSPIVYAIPFVISLGAMAAHATGFLTLESSPTNAEVWYTGPDEPDKKYLGDTPLEKREMATGHYAVWLILPSHDTLAIPDVSILEGQVTQMNREIPTHYGYLEVTTDPDSSLISLDGVKIGPSPYVNTLVLPGTSKLLSSPREAYFKNSSRTLKLNKGDSSLLVIQAPYRDKSFMYENLSLPAWRLQLETGIEYRAATGRYDSSSTVQKFATDSIRRQWDFPISLRIGLPQGIEAHLLVPYKSYDKKYSAIPNNLRAGIKYTYRPLNFGFDMSYGFGVKNSKEALTHDYLALTLMAMAAKDKIVGEAQGGFEFHFADKMDNKLTPGNVAFVHVQAGYLLDPFLPYLGLSGRFHLDGDYDGKPSNSSGYILMPEPGLVIDIDDLLSLQFGVPFTIVGKNELSYWGLHLSFSLGFGFK